jgi:MazG family protein
VKTPDLQTLIETVAALRDPGEPTAWAGNGDFASIVAYTLEEAYEVVDVIERGAFHELREELGDLLLQVLLYAQMAREQDLFSFADVCEALLDKLKRRHPRFATPGLTPPPPGGSFWEQRKRDEREKAAVLQADGGVLAGIARNLPALRRAYKLQRRAAQVGFDWADITPIVAKIHEELDELKAELTEPRQEDRVREELGDLLFACVNLARHLRIDAEAALRQTNTKFERRFAYIEAQLIAQGRSVDDASLAEMDALWEEAKTASPSPKNTEPSIDPVHDRRTVKAAIDSGLAATPGLHHRK